MFNGDTSARLIVQTFKNDAVGSLTDNLEQLVAANLLHSFVEHHFSKKVFGNFCQVKILKNR